MPPEPAPAGPGRDESRPGKPPAPGQPARPEPGNALSGGTTPWPAWEPVITRPDWMTEEDLARLDSLTEADEPWWLEEGDPDPEEDASPDDRDFAEIAAGCRQATEDRARAAAVAARLGTTGALGAIAASSGRRGPDQPGSAQVFPGEDSGPAAQFATGLLLDTMPGRPELARFADAAAGPDDAFNGASDDELLGVLCAWERLESHAAARKHAAAAELIRRRPARDGAAEGPARMPRAWDEFTAAELCAVLARSRYDADQMLGLAHDLEVKLPGTKAAFLDGIVNQGKAEIIARATAVLDAKEAQAAEALVLDRAGRLTPGGLRSAIARAVIEVAPATARKRREQAAREARVERWAQASGNAALAGLELPPAQVYAADQKINALARQLKQAGLDGSMDQLRARAFLDLLLGTDSWPRPDGASGQDGTGLGALAGDGFAGKITLTVPLATLLGLAAAQNLKTTWCVTVTDEHGHAIGHGCAKPEPKNHGKRDKPGAPGGHDPPSGSRDGPGFTFMAAGRPGPPGGYGSWQLRTRRGREQDLIVALDPIATGDCDHRFEAKRHDPGVKLRHLTQVRHATCTGLGCRRPSAQADFEHNIPYEAGGRTCLCNGGPKCRHDHRLKQNPRWKVDQRPDGTFIWTTPSGRQYTTEPTRYPT